MSKGFMLGCLFSLCSMFSYGQARNFTGMMAIGCGTGITQHGFLLSPQFEYIVLPKFTLKGVLINEFAAYKGYGFNTFSLYVNGNYTYLNIKESIFLKIGGGVIGQLGYIHDVKSLNSDLASVDGNYGFAIEPEVDFFIFKSLVLYSSFIQSYYIRDYMGHFVYYVNVGFKYQF